MTEPIDPGDRPPQPARRRSSAVVIIVVLVSFFPLAVSAADGLASTDPDLIALLRAMGAKRGQIWRIARLPAALPSILTGLRISFGTGWAAIIAAELVAARSGLGYLISNGMEILRADRVLVGMIVISILGVCFDIFFRFVQRRISWGAFLWT